MCVRCSVCISNCVDLVFKPCNTCHRDRWITRINQSENHSCRQSFQRNRSNCCASDRDSVYTWGECFILIIRRINSESELAICRLIIKYSVESEISAVDWRSRTAVLSDTCANISHFASVRCQFKFSQSEDDWNAREVVRQRVVGLILYCTFKCEGN